MENIKMNFRKVVIEPVQGFKTIDGKGFFSEEEAIEHSLQLNFIEELRPTISAILTNNNLDTLKSIILNGGSKCDVVDFFTQELAKERKSLEDVFFQADIEIAI